MSFIGRRSGEMCRVATEVRLFPLLALDARRSPHVDAIVTECGRSGFEVSIEIVLTSFNAAATR